MPEEWASGTPGADTCEDVDGIRGVRDGANVSGMDDEDVLRGGFGWDAMDALDAMDGAGGEMPGEDEEFVNICLDEEKAGDDENVGQVEEEDGVYRIDPPNTEMMVNRTRSPIKMINASFICDWLLALFV